MRATCNYCGVRLNMEKAEVVSPHSVSVKCTACGETNLVTQETVPVLEKRLGEPATPLEK